MSFRRQVYVHPEDVNKLPESLKVTFEDTTFWIYISTDIVTCFNCKQTGHLAKDCSINVTITETAANTTEPIQKLTQTQGANTALQPLQNKADNATINNNTGDIDCDIGKLTSNQKRPLSSASSSAYTPSITRNNKIDWCLTSDDSSYEMNSKETKTKLYKKKKPKIESCDSNNTEQESTDNLLLLVKDHLNEHSDEQYLTYLQLRSFLEKSKGCADITEVNREFAEDTNKIISTLRYTYSLLTERSTKNRFTRLILKLSTTLKSPENCIDADMTDSSNYTGTNGNE
ncbi:hypothetical protein KPH14_007637 [Odynerus spinipes]|uniref:CCHC-type domain-containing protein n=1 Tax=Odynerus spinipes TaxID=1348599 RepID=A0AAD9RHN6_9HYME|nr:hypothetical protein KPH14_007637 [Odynerus spinipes]